MFCRKCGKTIPDDSKFCPYCGETIVIEESQPTAKKIEHGYCSQCGNPLPDGKLTGLCDDCLNKAGIETAPYGRCEQCGKPLKADDGTLCQDCANKLLSQTDNASFHSVPDGNIGNQKKHIARDVLPPPVLF